MKHADLVKKVQDAGGGKEFGAANAIKVFAELLGALAEDADKSVTENIQLQTEVRDLTKELRDMTWWLKFLTIVILVVGIVAAYPGIKEIYNDIASSFHSTGGFPESDSNPQN
jgi:NTP pyrophosphatase (non-canonical NTP hydrolase)